MKRWKETLAMATSTVMMLPTKAWASSDNIQKAIEGASKADFDSIEGFLVT